MLIPIFIGKEIKDNTNWQCRLNLFFNLIINSLMLILTM